MQFRYDFGDKLDLTKFRKQAEHYIGTMQRLTYIFFVKDFKVMADIVTPDGCNGHMVTISIREISRDADGELTDQSSIIPLNDLRFKQIKEIKEVFIIDQPEGNFDSNSVTNTINKICCILNIVQRINNLRAFL